MTHSNPSLISDRTNGDVSSDFYHMYPNDIQFASSIGVSQFNTIFKYIIIFFTTLLLNSCDSFW